MQGSFQVSNQAFFACMSEESTKIQEKTGMEWKGLKMTGKQFPNKIYDLSPFCKRFLLWLVLGLRDSPDKQAKKAWLLT